MAEVVISDGSIAFVDDEDFDRVATLKWSASTNRNGQIHAKRNLCLPGGKRRWLPLGNFILGIGPGIEVDHIDRNPMNCRRANLRPASRQQNAMNRGPIRGLKGVHPAGKSWVAKLRVDGQLLHLGTFATADAAAHAYDREAFARFGVFAYLNFPQDMAA